MHNDSGAAAFSGSIDLAAENLGGETLLCSDEFFAPMNNLLKADPAIFIHDKYTDRGKWMDGWEPRRRRAPGHDWCIIQLGVPGTLHGVDIDTAHFTGNHPPFASLDAVHAPDATPEALRDEVQWTRVLDQVPLKRGAQNLFALAAEGMFTHVRLNIYPAGGVARLRVYGHPEVARQQGDLDLAGLQNGARALACSDMFFSPMNNLLLPQRAEHMGQGWETRRSRPPGMDWIIIQLSHCGEVHRLEVDTNHFKGNYPDHFAVDALCWPDAPPHALTRWNDWTEIVPDTSLMAHRILEVPVSNQGPWTHLRLRIYPDGGVSRLRAWGRPVDGVVDKDPLIEFLNGLPVAEAQQAFERCCGARRWASGMVAARPYVSLTHLIGTATDIWWHLGDGDWLEAFQHHPQIGADIEALREKFAKTASLSESEQRGVASASSETLEALAKANQLYLEQFGFIFIVCATGKGADEMLELLNGRLSNELEYELRVAAGEQMKITILRMKQLGDAS